MNLSSSLLGVVRGGQTTAHGLRMSVQIFRYLLFIGLGVFLLTLILNLRANERLDTHNWRTVRSYASSYVLVYFFKSKTDQLVSFTDFNGAQIQVSRYDILTHPKIYAEFSHFRAEFIRASWLGLGVSVGVLLVVLLFLGYRGRELTGRRHIRGSRLVKTAALRRFLERHNRVLRFKALLWDRKSLWRSFHLVGFPYPVRSELTHTKVLGSTGSGKTMAIQELVHQIRKKNARAVIFDKTGNYVASFYDPRRGDKILNPLDARSEAWNPFTDVRLPDHFSHIAASLIAQQQGMADPFWVMAAREVLTMVGNGILQKMPHLATNKGLCEVLFQDDYTLMREVVKDTPASNVVDPKNLKTALSVRAVLSVNLAFLRSMPSDQPETFSVRNWIEGGEGILFLTSRSDIHDSLRPLLSCWMDLSINHLLSLPEARDKTIWFILDELASLNKLPSVMQGLNEARKYGGCFVLGFQTIDALMSVYGQHDTRAMMGCCRTSLFGPAPDKDTATYISENLGMREEQIFRETKSIGAERLRDGSSFAGTEVKTPIVLPSEVMGLPDLHAYLKFSQGAPVSLVPIPLYRQRRRPAPSYQLRSDHAQILTSVQTQVAAGRAEMVDLALQQPPSAVKTAPSVAPLSPNPSARALPSGDGLSGFPGEDPEDPDDLDEELPDDPDEELSDDPDGDPAFFPEDETFSPADDVDDPDNPGPTSEATPQTLSPFLRKRLED